MLLLYGIAIYIMQRCCVIVVTAVLKGQGRGGRRVKGVVVTGCNTAAILL